MASQPRILGANSPAIRRDTRVVEWHYDFLLRCGALANGATTPEIDLPITPGAPFFLRGIGGYHIEPGLKGLNNSVTQLTGGFLQWTNNVDSWLQSQAIGLSGDWASGGQDALYEPVHSQVIYPPNSVLSVKLTNLSGSNWTDARLVFRGTKLYLADAVYNPTYPARFKALPYQAPVQFPESATGAGVITTASGGTLREVPLTARGSDLVIRGGHITVITNLLADTQIMLYDQNGRRYASDFIAARWLFSSAMAERPGIWYPEIYLPKDRILLMDITTPSSAPVFNLVFDGSRIFPL